MTSTPARVGVLGGGRMGAGITHAFLLAGSRVTVIERDAPAADAAAQRIGDSLARSVERGSTDRPLNDLEAALTVGDDIAAFADADLPHRVLDNGALLLARPVPVGRLPGFAEGLVSVQDAGAQYAAGYLDLAAGQRVLDACAAPGGKTSHMLESADVALTALDADPQRARRVSENLERLGLHAEVKTADCRDLARWWDGRPFDRILADVPCSASGVVRRNPDIKWLRRAEDVARFAAQQAEILDALWQVLAPGGKMLYVTCSVFAEENRDQVAAFIARHPDCCRLPLAGQPDCQYLPCAEHDGFFYALLERTA